MSQFQSIGSMLGKPRFTAFLLHFGVSLALIAAVFALIYLAWFPRALSAASGGLEGLTIVAAVDVVLGPLLTFVIYDVAKPKSHLARDIGVIVFLQLSCLIAGVYIVHQARPLAVVHVHDTFHVLGKPDFDALDIDSSELSKFAEGYPKVLYVDTEKNPVAFLTKKILNKLNRSRPFYLRMDLYREMPRDSGKIASILKGKKPGNNSGCTVQNIESAYTSGTVCFHPDTFMFTDFIAGNSVSLLDDIEVKYEAKPK